MSSRDRSSKVPPDGKYPTGSRLFVGNLDTTTVTKKDVKILFEKYGKLQEDIRLHKGFCFIQYDNVKAAQEAMEKENGKQMGSKIIEVELAHGKKSSKLESKLAAGKRSFRDDAEESERDSKRRRDSSSRSRRDFSPASRDHTSSPYGQPRRELSLFVLYPELLAYAHHVRDQLLMNLGSSYGIEPIIKQEERVHAGIDRARNETNKYTIIINKKNENEKTIAFRAINPDGTTPGFADTALPDVIQYIIKQEAQQPSAYATSYSGTTGIQQSPLHHSAPLHHQTPPAHHSVLHQPIHHNPQQYHPAQSYVGQQMGAQTVIPAQLSYGSNASGLSYDSSSSIHSSYDPQQPNFASNFVASSPAQQQQVAANGSNMLSSSSAAPVVASSGYGLSSSALPNMMAVGRSNALPYAADATSSYSAAYPSSAAQYYSAPAPQPLPHQLNSSAQKYYAANTPGSQSSSSLHQPLQPNSVQSLGNADLQNILALLQQVNQQQQAPPVADSNQYYNPEQASTYSAAYPSMSINSSTATGVPENMSQQRYQGLQNSNGVAQQQQPQNSVVSGTPGNSHVQTPDKNEPSSISSLLNSLSNIIPKQHSG